MRFFGLRPQNDSVGFFNTLLTLDGFFPGYRGTGSAKFKDFPRRLPDGLGGLAMQEVV
jgi:hypothetical protein